MSSTILSLIAKKSILVCNGVSSSYGTWALSRFSHLNAEYLFNNAGRAQPVLEVEKVIARKDEIMKNIEIRKIKGLTQAHTIPELYSSAKKFLEERQEVEKRRNENTLKVQELIKSLKDDEKDIKSDEIKALRKSGKELRDVLRKSTQKFNDVNDELVDLILSLPNALDPATPHHQYEVLRNISPPEGVPHFKRNKIITWDRAPAVAPNPDFTHGDGLWAELELAAKCQKCLLDAEFAETGNVDFVKRVLLEGTGLDPGSCLRIRETKIQHAGIAHAIYLVGGASFPAFLALFAQSVIQNEQILPIKYFVVGRTYSKGKDGTGPTQTAAVQAFVACRDEKEQEAEFAQMTELMENFYSKTLGITLESRLLAAPDLNKYERKKVSFVETGTEKVIGDLATVGDYVSKRLLCCYHDTKRSPKFLNMVTGQFLNITNFLRPSKLESTESTNDKTDGTSDLPPKGNSPGSGLTL